MENIKFKCTKIVEHNTKVEVEFLIDMSKSSIISESVPTSTKLIFNKEDADKFIIGDVYDPLYVSNIYNSI